MPSYYVMHPSIRVSATVDAPSAEKARTTYLDYLERTGKISRRWRQQLRQNLVAEKLGEPSEAYTDVHLSYDFTGEQSREAMLLSSPPVEEEYAPMPETEEYSSESEEPSAEEQPQPRMMPIAEAAMEGFLT